MKTLDIDPTIDAALKVCSNEPIVLTRGTRAVALVFSLPEGANVAEYEHASVAKESTAVTSEGDRPYGICKGMMTIIAEDDEHLNDFKEYM